MKKAGALLISILILIVLFHSVIYVVNNFIATGMERQLRNCQLPPESEMIESTSVAGKVLGGSNGMQWYGILLIRSDMSEEELLQWYKSHMSPAENEEIYVIRQKGPEMFDYGERRFHSYPDDGPCYQIQLFRSLAVGTESSIWESLLNHDLRGH